MIYSPSQTILQKYADVLIKFALWSGKGMKEGEKVFIQVPECAKPILKPLMLSVLEQGGHPLINYIPNDIKRAFFDNATMKQIEYMPKKYMLERVNECDHFVGIIAEKDKHELEGVGSKKILAQNIASKFFRDARNTKEYAGKLTWTLALYGTPAMAKEAKMTMKDYWKQIEKACFLDYKDPIAKWRRVVKKQKEIINKLNRMQLNSLHIKGKTVDLKILLGAKRKWVGGSGRNIPSFEIFTSPDWSGSNGWVKFDQPLFLYGNLITDIELEFKNGVVVRSSASKNEKLLKNMIKVKNADKIGEFSLTDKRFSRITKFMAETLFDENVGGRYGNFHIALGMAYKDTFDGNPKNVKKSEWEKLGYNLDTVLHTDIMSTTDRTVTARLANGKEKVIYEKGMFCL
ncbi:MAG: aminopeptidase [Patescibacteria group bacterium]|nr:aminopeptidase [Patescibacteria group bacterium]